MRDDGIGALQDRGSGTIVLLELDGFGIGPIALEIEDIADVGTTPRVDRLVIVADDHEIAMPRSEQLRYLVLGPVRILILVDKYVMETLTVLLAYVGMLGQQRVHVDEQVVEIHRIGTFETLLVRLEYLGKRLIELVVGTWFVISRTHELVFASGYACPHRVFGEATSRIAVVGHDVLDKPFGIIGIVDGEVVAVAENRGVGAQDAYAHAMEGVDPHTAQTACGKCR